MKEIYSVEIDRYNPMALADVLGELSNGIPDFEYDWRLSVNAGGIDYGIYLNVNIDRKEIEICNRPEYGTDGDDLLEDILENFEENEDDEEDE